MEEVEGRMRSMREEVEGEGKKEKPKKAVRIIPSCNNSTTDCILTGRETEGELERGR